MWQVSVMSDDYDSESEDDDSDDVVVEINQTCRPPAFTKLACEGR